ncbi:GTPase-activating 26 [Octopus vulgaris]|uniref:GTPase-activating 26 n=2 Tax=Octopus TaxID=6643 RepID=A0AA36F9H4_OCTVU|nr:GTPase-activating 26 [Octopus vulgaris]
MWWLLIIPDLKMGKVGCKRWRFHNSAVKLESNPADTNSETEKADVGPVNMENNSKNLPQKTKKQKFQDRKQYWKNQINSICTQKLQAKEMLLKKIQRKQMKNTPVVGDLTDMKDSLPTFTTKKETAEEKPLPYKPPVKLKSRRKEMLENINLFKQVLSHPVFKQNPGSAITEHLQNKVEHMNSLSDDGLRYVKRLIKFIEHKGITSTGIYRICGVQSEISEAMNIFSRDDCDKIPDGITAYSVAVALKTYFRNLSEPLLTTEFYWPLMNISKQKNKERLYSCIRTIPQINICFLLSILKHLYNVSECPENIMSSYSLAVCWSPVLLWHDQTSIDQAVLVPWIIQTLIENYHNIL